MFLEGMAQKLLERWTTRGVRLHLEGLERLGQVVFHPNTFRRAVLNLMQNAVDAMPQCGTLTLRGLRTGSQIQLEVTDTGRGIPEDEVSLLFTPWHTTKPEGTGLGLCVVQEIMAAHEGTIAVRSTPGTGTTFIMTLPRAVTASG
jgi:signal transduction histidine kinase